MTQGWDEVRQVDFVAHRFSPAHIVDVLIEERARHLLNNSFLWPLIRRFLYPLLHYQDAVKMADAIAPMSGRQAFDYLTSLLKLRTMVAGLEHVPREGGCIIVGNHPTGIADGLALYQALKGVRDDLCFVANQDALRVAPGLAEIVIPVEWVIDKRTFRKTREMWRKVRQALGDGRALVMFPSGRVAQWKGTYLVDRPWQAATITFATRNRVPIIPLRVSGANSWIYYFFAQFSQELRDMTLFNELLNKQGKEFRLSFGPARLPTQLSGDPEVEILRLKHYVEKDLPRDRPFKSV